MYICKLFVVFNTYLGMNKGLSHDSHEHRSTDANARKDEDKPVNPEAKSFEELRSIFSVSFITWLMLCYMVHFNP